tara:strand:+ start:303 stop:683 length:381 start_codon:yes stop_codon:yes gene_type:complete
MSEHIITARTNVAAGAAELIFPTVNREMVVKSISMANDAILGVQASDHSTVTVYGANGSSALATFSNNNSTGTAWTAGGVQTATLTNFDQAQFSSGESIKINKTYNASGSVFNAVVTIVLSDARTF